MTKLILEHEPIDPALADVETVKKLPDPNSGELYRLVNHDGAIYTAVGLDGEREWSQVTVGAGDTFRIREDDVPGRATPRIWGGYVDLKRAVSEASGLAAQLGLPLESTIGA